jgi:hypothetical protein
VRGRVSAALLAAGSVAVFASLFLHWYRVGEHFVVLFGALDRIPFLKSGWELLSVLDLALAAIAAGGLVLAALIPRLARSLLVAYAFVAGGGIIAVVLAVSDPPAIPFNPGSVDLVPDIGAYLAIGGLAVMAGALVVAATARRAPR